jgi:uncharacterized Zn finger protein
MPRESAATKARRLLAEGRVRITRVEALRVGAVVRGDSAGLYAVAFHRGRWSCTCEARGRCSHIRATQLCTVVRRPQEATS